MAGVTKSYISGRFRLLRTFSYRNEKNKPQNIKKIIGTFDPVTDELIFNDYFLDLIKLQDITIDQIRDIGWKNIPKIVNFGTFNKDDKSVSMVNNLNKISNSNIDKENVYNINSKERNIHIIGHEDIKQEIRDFSCKKYGPFLLLKSCLYQTGLLKVLESTFPDIWTEIITLSFFLVCNNKPVMYCDAWTEDNITFLRKRTLQSQRISELLQNISFSKIMTFYEKWAKCRIESEYLALDITSISSYSNLVKAVEFGYNRDNENLPQINYCLLYGEESGLPVYSSLYTGSIHDVSTLESFIDQLCFIDDKSFNLVLDKGFYSKSNIQYLLKRYPSYKFLMSIPFTTELTRKIVSQGKSQFDDTRYFQINNDILLGRSFTNAIANDQMLNYHVIYNEKLYTDKYNSMIANAIKLRNKAITNPSKYINNKTYNRYLIFDKNKSLHTYDVKINSIRIKYELRNAGWLIIVGNDLNLSYESVCNIYRSKDCVEKSFDRLKNNLDLSRLIIHSDEILANKLFIAFISMIIIAYIHNIMNKNNLYSYLSLLELLDHLGKIKIVKSNENQTMTPISKLNKKLLSVFDIIID
jgi:transposase